MTQGPVKCLTKESLISLSVTIRTDYATASSCQRDDQPTNARMVTTLGGHEGHISWSRQGGLLAKLRLGESQRGESQH